MYPEVEQIKKWIEEVIAQKRELPHMDFKREEASADKLLKDITAMYNTPDSPFDGYGYIVIGVHNDHSVHGLTERDRKSHTNADKRENSLTEALAAHAIPIPPVRVVELTLDAYPEAPLHVIEVPTTSGVWSYIHTDKADKGYFVRRGTQSKPPKPPEIEAYLQRLLFTKTEALQQELTALQAIALEQRRQLDHLIIQHAPREATNAQVLSAALNTPERTLLRSVRGEIANYLQKHEAIDYHLYYALERQHDEYQMPKDKIEEVKHLLEHLEDLTRPLVELLGILAHDIKLPDKSSLLFKTLEQVLAEIGNAVAFTGPNPDTRALNPQISNAVRAYPAIMLLFASATLSVSGTPGRRWYVLERLFRHHRPFTSMSGHRTSIYLYSHWDLRPGLDYLVKLFDRTYPNGAASERMGALMRRVDWLGQYMPATESRRLVSNAEIIATLAYIGAALQQGVEPPFVSGAWMHYTDLERQFRLAMEHVDPQALLSLAEDRKTWNWTLELLKQQMVENHINFRFDPLTAFDEIQP